MPAQALIPVALTAAALGVAFAPTFGFLYGKWANDPQYSHGFLVPVVSAYLLWRSVSAATSPVLGSPRPVLAILLFAVAAAFRGLAGGLLFHQLDVASLFLCLIGLALLAGGFRTLRVAAPALGFLIFMVPLPYELERNLGTPLRLVATQSSTYLLQTLGEPAVAEGNTILLDSHTLEVEDACSGLKMLVTFAAFAVGAVLTLNRTWFERGMVLLGIVPIAVLTNVLRITATGVSYAYAGDSKSTMHFLHDLYGWLMMPVGLGLLALQLWCLSRLVVRDDPTGPFPHSPYGAAP
jgi:exosortase